MEPDFEKLCVNCRFVSVFHGDMATYISCRNPEVVNFHHPVSPVTGKSEWDFYHCERERKGLNNPCGPQGKLYQEKPQRYGLFGLW